MLTFDIAQIVSNPCSVQYLTVTNQADLDSLSSCAVFTGAIVVQGYNIPISAVSLSLPTGLKSIVNGDLQKSFFGDLDVLNIEALSEFTAPGLEHIDNSFTLNNLTGLKTCSLPNLQSVWGYFDIENVPLLENMTLPTVEIASGSFFAIRGTGLHAMPNFAVTDLYEFSVGWHRPQTR